MSAQPRLDEPTDAASHVVHFPLPDALRWDRAGRVELLEGVQWLMLVGSPARARKVAAAARDARGAEVGCYCDLTVPGRDETGRELALYVLRMKEGPVVAVASHGIGLSGVELCISEVPALITVATGGRFGALRGIVRAGTRGTIAPVPLGCVALSTACHDDDLNRVDPDRWLTDQLRAAARLRGMSVVADEAIEGCAQAGWPAAPERLLIEGPGVATHFFWSGQGRPLFIPGEGGHSRPRPPAETAARAATLTRWVDAGIRWVEMEDYTVHRLARLCGYPSASVGAVIASRRRPDGSFQVDYDHAAHARAEMIPTELALDGILQASRSLTEQS